VQHVPWIVAGGPFAGARCDGLTEHVDVVPSLAALLGLALPAAAAVDGTAWFDGGTLRRPCGGRTVFHAWEDYRAARTGHYLLIDRPSDGVEARCHGAQDLYRVDGLRRQPVTGSSATRRLRRLARVLRDRLDARERRYRAARYAVPTVPFLVRTDFWHLDPPTAIRCVTLDEETPKSTPSSEVGSRPAAGSP
jgi:arylsulfatase A-like enzyme